MVLPPQPRVLLPQRFTFLHDPLHIRPLLGLPAVELELLVVDALLLQAVTLVASSAEPGLPVEVHADRPAHGALGKLSQAGAERVRQTKGGALPGRPHSRFDSNYAVSGACSHRSAVSYLSFSYSFRENSSQASGACLGSMRISLSPAS